ncbi:TonB-dependent receptor-like protein [Chitinophaga niastensis]|uniref:TonB-dependent receptor-like protein n=1 Tax=Chitinophaga niastensis TaxID=536980 RepID=A0A2P8HLT6_CHINA|nr:outer membrane beta-barrel family protein [Chitinophaga niastensis]PSL47171.1 TonB-dependent receptor-like protein [Chitinophaga niastensis]
MLRSLFVLHCCILAMLSLQAQVTIKGKVIDSVSSTGIGYISISLLAVPDSVRVKTMLSDPDGLIELTAVQPGKYTLFFSSLGYTSRYKPVEVLPHHTMIDLGEIRMVSQSRALQSVTISGERSAVQYRADRVVLQVAGNSLYKTATNVFDIVRKAPGIAENPDGTLLMSGRNTPVIFINGKPVPMSVEEQQNYLNSLSPDLIESIDIISNPSSRYDAQYKGIIDIKLKRDQSLGWQGNISSNYRQNDYASSENNGQLTFKTKQWIYSLRMGYVNGTNPYQYKALQHQANTNYMATNTMNSTRLNNFNAQLGIEYAINKTQSIGISGKSYQSNRDLHSFNTLHFTDSTQKKTVGYTQSINQAAPSQQNNAININYDGRFGRHRLNVFGSFTKVENRQKEDIQNRDQLTSNLISYWKTSLQNYIDLRTIQADYSGQLSKGLLEAGAKFAFITTRNNLRYDTLNNEKSFVPDASRTNQFLYDEYISAAYVSYEHKGDNYAAKLSVRAEHTYTKANAITMDAIEKRNYLTWLPGASFSYNINANQQINLSFTRRITRPGFDQLNPFRFYLSPLNYWVGNPYLQPAVTNLLNLSYNNRNFSISLSLGREENPMSRYPEYNKITNELLYLGRNLPYRDFGSIESGYGFTITKWWKTNHTMGIYYNKEQTPYFGVTYAIGILDYTINGSQVFSLPKGFTADLSYYYKSKSGNGLYISAPITSINMGLQRNWLNGKLNTKLNFYDLFNTNLVRLTFREKTIIDNRFSHWNGNQRFVATVAYNFGKANYRAKQTRTTDEEKRVSN